MRGLDRPTELTARSLKPGLDRSIELMPRSLKRTLDTTTKLMHRSLKRGPDASKELLPGSLRRELRAAVVSRALWTDSTADDVENALSENFAGLLCIVEDTYDDSGAAQMGHGLGVCVDETTTSQNKCMFLHLMASLRRAELYDFQNQTEPRH